MPSKEPFKKFYCNRDEVFSLPDAAFKIWMFHYRLEGKERQSWPSRETICKKLKISINKLTRWRRWLQEHGWLEKIGERDSHGEFCVPVFKVKDGTVYPKQVHGPCTQNDAGTGTQNGATVRYPKQVQEVDTYEVDRKEVEELPMTNRQKGKYKKGEFSHLNGKPDRIYGQFVEIWSEAVGAGAVCKKPFKSGWDWFVDTCGAAEADTLVPAFELWAEENASASEDRPIGAFLGNLTQYTQRLAGPKAIDPHVELVRKRSIERDIAEAKERNANALYKPPEQEGESIEELIARLEKSGSKLEN